MYPSILTEAPVYSGRTDIRVLNVEVVSSCILAVEEVGVELLRDGLEGRGISVDVDLPHRSVVGNRHVFHRVWHLSVPLILVLLPSKSAKGIEHALCNPKGLVVVFLDADHNLRAVLVGEI